MRSYLILAAGIAICAVLTLAGWYPSRLSQQEAMYAAMLYTLFPAWLFVVLLDSRALGLRPPPLFWAAVVLMFAGLSVYSVSAYLIDGPVPPVLGVLCAVAGFGGCWLTLPYVRTMVETKRASRRRSDQSQSS